MNIEKWTAKMQEAIQKAITMASEMGHQVVDVEHFLLALLEDNAGILYRVLSKANVNIADLQNKLNVRLQGKPIVSNVDINSIRISYDLNQLSEIPRFNEACAGFLPVLSPIKAEPPRIFRCNAGFLPIWGESWRSAVLSISGDASFTASRSSRSGRLRLCWPTGPAVSGLGARGRRSRRRPA